MKKYFYIFLSLIFIQTIHAAAFDEQATKDLFNAILHNDLIGMQIAIDQGANPNGTTFYNNTPLHFAFTVPQAKLLIKYGAKIDALNTSGLTPLCAAPSKKALYYNTHHSNPQHNLIKKTFQILHNTINNLPNRQKEFDDYVTFLIKSDANVNATTYEESKTPLFYAKSYRQVKDLIAAGANPNQQKRIIYLTMEDYLGDTPLHLAPTEETTQALLENGANPTIKNTQQETPLIYAINNRKEENIYWLLKHGKGIIKVPLIYKDNSFVQYALERLRKDMQVKLIQRAMAKKFNPDISNEICDYL